MRLVIVESPAKAKTIEKFLGPEYKVAASYGHIRDLPSSADEIPDQFRSEDWARLAVDTEHGFRPVYIVPENSRKHVTNLRKLLQKADEVILATDEDREGESISWHLLDELKPETPVKRIAFHEITRTAIREALENPRQVDDQLVRAQESRRILDRLYGYSLSPVLWRKVRSKLSAGRVQSVALKLIVEREEERQAFQSTTYWDVSADFEAQGVAFTATLVEREGRRLATSRDFDSTTGLRKPGSESLLLDEETARAIAQALPASLPWRVAALESKQTTQRPAPPFTTSTLQQAASSQLNMGPGRTMQVAQRLYEGVDMGGGEREGLITYMRTDSLTLSERAIEQAASVIHERFGKDYHQGPRRYKAKSKNAQEAHEAIRPTELTRHPDDVASLLDREELALYRLIWNRTLASQMADAIVDRSSVEFEARIQDLPHRFRATGSVLRFPGFRRVYGGPSKDSLLPPLQEGQQLGSEGDSSANLAQVEPQRHDTKPPARYTEASLVKKLEEEGIGRPSTYASIISTIEGREYVLKKGGALVPSYVGMAVVHLLRKHFPHYIDTRFTARMEDQLDEIARGETDHQRFLQEFYKGNGGDGLLDRIEAELPRIDYPQIPVGQDPETGQPLHVRIGKNSAFVQRGEGGSGNSATLPAELLIDELTPEKAAELLDLQQRSREPITQDPESGLPVYLLSGPYGPYLQLGETPEKGGKKPKRIGLPKGKNPEEVDEAFALQLISLPRVLGQDPETGLDVQASLGRFGPYVQRAREFRSLPDFDSIFTIGFDEALALVNTPKQRGKQILAELGQHPESGKAVQVIRGRYGPYVSDGSANATLPDDRDPESLTLDEALPMLEAAAARKGRKKATKKKATKKKATKKKAAKKATKKKSAKKKAAKKASKKSAT